MLEFVDGNTALLRAAIDAGCDFFAGYPITPATSILLEAVRELPPRGGVVVQGEDEIASIGMCLAAAMAGRKAMTASSGPGMSLFSETLGLAVMGEVPLVVVDVQRMGPATGGATTSADGDVQFARWCAPGGYPIPVLAPTDVRSAYVVTRHAFNLAERLRTPVILLSSKEVAMTRQTVDLDAERDGIPVATRTPFEGPGSYLPYHVARPQDVPAFSPIGGEHPVRFTTSIHDERGEITSDASRIAAKLTHLERKITEGTAGVVLADDDIQDGAETLVVAYGVAAAAARDAVDDIRAGGGRVSLLTLFTLWPFPDRRVRAAARGHARVVVPEHNFGQVAREVERAVHGAAVVPLQRVDGGMISPSAIVGTVGAARPRTVRT